MKTKFRPKFLSIFSLMLVMWVASASSVFAATNTESGVVITVTTDKQEYEAGETINATVTLRNDNDVAAEAVSLECIVPEGYKVEGETTLTAESLAAAEELKLEVALVSLTAPAETPDASTDAVDAPAADAEEGGNALLWIVVAVVAVVVVIVIVAASKKKGGKGTKALSIVLAGALLASAANGLTADAAAKEYAVSATETVKVAGADVAIEAKAAYTLDKVDLNDLLNVKEFDEENAIIVEAESYLTAESTEQYIKDGYEGEAVKCNGAPTYLTWEVTIDADNTYQFVTIGTGMQSTVGIPIVGNIYINDELVIEGTMNTNEKFNPWDNPLRSQLGAIELTAGTYKVTFESFLGCYIMDKLAIEPKFAE